MIGTVTSESLLPEVKTLLRDLDPSTLPSAFVGFDGFIDSIQKAVKKTEDGKIIFFKTIHDFAAHLDQMNGKSGQVEFVTSQTKMGGNAPILSSALGKLGIPAQCLGTMGFPEVNPLFKNRNIMMDLISISSPGESHAIEFDNGKIIFSDLSTFRQYNWDYIKRRVNFSQLRKTVEKSRLLALVDWANLPHATDLWRGFLHDVVMPIGRKDQFFLFDLCDPSKKSTTQIREVLKLISRYSDYGTVVLGLNENEANTIWKALHKFTKASEKKTEIPSLEAVGSFIFNSMSIDTLLIHPRDRTLIFRNQKTSGMPSVVELYGHLVKNPKVQTGAGDNLNAGFCLGLLAGFDMPDCMVLGMAASGAYVQNGTSPDITELIDYLKGWSGEEDVLAEDETVKYFTGY
jgi:hypothetical protein